MMGYAGHWEAREVARILRAEGWTVPQIAIQVCAAKSSVARWVSDIPFTPGPRHRGGPAVNHPLRTARLSDEQTAADDARVAIGEMSPRELFLVGLALYAGEGAKTGNTLRFANSDPNLIRLFLVWLRTSFVIDERKLRVALYLHDGLDLDLAVRYWSDLCLIPRTQFTKPYRAVADASRRVAKHPMGCPSVRYSDVRVFRRVLAGAHALCLPGSFPG
jgi:hypothetical protein